MGRDKERLLRDLKQRKHSCTYELAEEALESWGFQPGRAKGHAQVWCYKELTLTLHRPHKKHMDPGAVATVIRLIELAEILQTGRGDDDA
ncbi:MAG TPA: hypothetical protein VHN15_13705 [Thermoanaerobaculia bacterium]|nr:hypothetical protein [Thermoanaerobaculia bacterium]